MLLALVALVDQFEPANCKQQTQTDAIGASPLSADLGSKRLQALITACDPHQVTNKRL